MSLLYAAAEKGEEKKEEERKKERKNTCENNGIPSCYAQRTQLARTNSDRLMDYILFNLIKPHTSKGIEESQPPQPVS